MSKNLNNFTSNHSRTHSRNPSRTTLASILVSNEQINLIDSVLANQRELNHQQIHQNQNQNQNHQNQNHQNHQNQLKISSISHNRSKSTSINSLNFNKNRLSLPNSNLNLNLNSSSSSLNSNSNSNLNSNLNHRHSLSNSNLSCFTKLKSNSNSINLFHHAQKESRHQRKHSVSTRRESIEIMGGLGIINPSNHLTQIDQQNLGKKNSSIQTGLGSNLNFSSSSSSSNSINFKRSSIINSSPKLHFQNQNHQIEIENLNNSYQNHSLNSSFIKPSSSFDSLSSLSCHPTQSARLNALSTLEGLHHPTSIKLIHSTPTINKSNPTTPKLISSFNQHQNTLDSSSSSSSINPLTDSMSTLSHHSHSDLIRPITFNLAHSSQPSTPSSIEFRSSWPNYPNQLPNLSNFSFPTSIPDIKAISSNLPTPRSGLDLGGNGGMGIIRDLSRVEEEDEDETDDHHHHHHHQDNHKNPFQNSHHHDLQLNIQSINQIKNDIINPSSKINHQINHSNLQNSPLSTKSSNSRHRPKSLIISPRSSISSKIIPISSNLNSIHNLKHHLISSSSKSSQSLNSNISNSPSSISSGLKPLTLVSPITNHLSKSLNSLNSSSSSRHLNLINSSCALGKSHSSAIKALESKNTPDSLSSPSTATSSFGSSGGSIAIINSPINQKSILINRNKRSHSYCNNRIFEKTFNEITPKSASRTLTHFKLSKDQDSNDFISPNSSCHSIISNTSSQIERLNVHENWKQTLNKSLSNQSHDLQQIDHHHHHPNMGSFGDLVMEDISPTQTNDHQLVLLQNQLLKSQDDYQKFKSQTKLTQISLEKQINELKSELNLSNNKNIIDNNTQLQILKIQLEDWKVKAKDLEDEKNEFKEDVDGFKSRLKTLEDQLLKEKQKIIQKDKEIIEKDQLIKDLLKKRGCRLSHPTIKSDLSSSSIDDPSLTNSKTNSQSDESFDNKFNHIKQLSDDEIEAEELKIAQTKLINEMRDQIFALASALAKERADHLITKESLETATMQIDIDALNEEGPAMSTFTDEDCEPNSFENLISNDNLPLTQSHPYQTFPPSSPLILSQIDKTPTLSSTNFNFSSLSKSFPNSKKSQNNLINQEKNNNINDLDNDFKLKKEDQSTSRPLHKPTSHHRSESFIRQWTFPKGPVKPSSLSSSISLEDRCFFFRPNSVDITLPALEPNKELINLQPFMDGGLSIDTIEESCYEHGLSDRSIGIDVLTVLTDITEEDEEELLMENVEKYQESVKPIFDSNLTTLPYSQNIYHHSEKQKNKIEIESKGISSKLSLQNLSNWVGNYIGVGTSINSIQEDQNISIGKNLDTINSFQVTKIEKKLEHYNQINQKETLRIHQLKKLAKQINFPYQSNQLGTYKLDNLASLDFRKSQINDLDEILLIEYDENGNRRIQWDLNNICFKI